MPNVRRALAWAAGIYTAIQCAQLAWFAQAVYDNRKLIIDYYNRFIKPFVPSYHDNIWLVVVATCGILLTGFFIGSTFVRWLFKE